MLSTHRAPRRVDASKRSRDRDGVPSPLPAPSGDAAVNRATSSLFRGRVLAISPDFALRNPGCFHFLCPLRRLVRRGDIGADHARLEFVDGHNVGCREREYSQCGPMDIGPRQCALTDVRIVECSRRIRKERDLIISEHGVTCRCVTAVFRRRARYDYDFDAPFPQYQIKVKRRPSFGPGPNNQILYSGFWGRIWWLLGQPHGA